MCSILRLFGAHSGAASHIRNHLNRLLDDSERASAARTVKDYSRG